MIGDESHKAGISALRTSIWPRTATVPRRSTAASDGSISRTYILIAIGESGKLNFCGGCYLRLEPSDAQKNPTAS